MRSRPRIKHRLAVAGVTAISLMAVAVPAAAQTGGTGSPGSTTEPNVLLAYFFARLRETVGESRAGQHVVTVTDPGSSMEKVAQRDKFRRAGFGRAGERFLELIHDQQ